MPRILNSLSGCILLVIAYSMYGARGDEVLRVDSLTVDRLEIDSNDRHAVIGSDDGVLGLWIGTGERRIACTDEEGRLLSFQNGRRLTALSVTSDRGELRMIEKLASSLLRVDEAGGAECALGGVGKMAASIRCKPDAVPVSGVGFDLFGRGSGSVFFLDSKGFWAGGWSQMWGVKSVVDDDRLVEVRRQRMDGSAEKTLARMPWSEEEVDAK